MSGELENKLDEAKATGEDSVAADPVTPTGGEVKKRKGDVKKKVDPKADEVEDDVKTPQGDHDVGMSEETDTPAFESIFEDEDLSEEFKTKAEAVFEAAVHEKVLAEKATLEEQYQTELEEAKEQFAEELVEKVDGYLDYVVEKWMQENEVQIESSIKVEVAESLLDSLKGLVEDHNLDVSDEQVDAVAELENRLEEQENKYNETIETLVALKEEKESLEREIALAEISEDLTDTEADKLSTLVEGISFENLEDYKSKVEAIKESYFTESVTSENDDTEYLEEETEESDSAKSLDENVTRYAQALSRLAKD
jgi:hypothetical protein